MLTYNFSMNPREPVNTLENVPNVYGGFKIPIEEYKKLFKKLNDMKK